MRELINIIHNCLLYYFVLTFYHNCPDSATTNAKNTAAETLR
ncbi:hypothetical protein EUBSIR_01357 [[Eubacterium] siraeum DSM 15702]|uniref:Uncharacterized protein n=1 Tax=[Eubacterium] siraeum DSM 15702 TaxID=428128 RepID=B0MNE6_9FIRM|nr:hypothetical protein EUBSIR_01357 [[Eubacterium] siraeum DSM 15702]